MSLITCILPNYLKASSLAKIHDLATRYHSTNVDFNDHFFAGCLFFKIHKPQGSKVARKLSLLRFFLFFFFSNACFVSMSLSIDFLVSRIIDRCFGLEHSCAVEINPKYDT